MHIDALELPLQYRYKAYKFKTFKKYALHNIIHIHKEVVKLILCLVK